MVLFFGSVFIATALELVGGFLLEKIFHKKWWDYSEMRYNLGGYICVEFSVIWGLACFVLYEAVHPLIERLFSLLNPKFIFYTDIILLIIFVVDLILTILTLIGLNKKFKKIEEANLDMRVVSDNIGRRVYDKTMKVKSRKEEIEESPKVKEIETKRTMIRQELAARFDKFGEKRILRAFPNLVEDLIDRVEKDIEEIEKLEK